jgi:hypothetical protein
MVRTGSPDFLVGGIYTGTINRTYKIEIDGNGVPDTFRWSDTGGAPWNATGVPVTGSNQLLNNGLVVRFNSTTGNTIGDDLTFSVLIFTDTLQIEDSEIPRADFASMGVAYSGGGSTGFFETVNTYRWAVSFIYDGYQESPLSVGIGVSPTGPSTNYTTATVTITLSNAAASLSSYNKRITSMKLYRANPDANGVFGFYRFVGDVDINIVNPVQGNAWYSENHVDYEVEITDDGEVGPSYEASTGISETLLRTTMDYSLSEVVNSQLFIGQCGTNTPFPIYQIPDAQFYLFRSNPYRYDTFDWTEDLLRLPYIPKAMSSYNGRLFVFCDNVIYRINPDGFFIEDVIHNISVINDRSVITIDAGMFWCDRENMYMYDGKAIHEIGNPVKTTDYVGGVSWQDFIGNTFDLDFVVVKYYENKNIVLFMAVGGDLLTYAFTYHLASRKWDYIKVIESGATTGLMLNLDGVLYLSRSVAPASVYRTFANTTYFPLERVSGELPKQELEQLKKFYKIIHDSTNITAQYSIDKGTTWRNLTNTVEIKDVGGDWEHKESVMIRLTSSGFTTAECSNLELIFRRMIGKR